ncbi:unnamed protein product, partial [Clonostachys chloroleuca]
PARDRHQLRCRVHPRSRRKACDECFRSKARCDSGLPACHRYSTLSRLCIYQLNAPVNHAQQQVLLGPPMTTSVDVASWTGQISHDSSVVVVLEWDTQQAMAHTSNIPPVLLTQQSQGHDTSVQPRSKSPVSLIISRCAQPTFGPTSEAFTSLSQFLTGQWTTAEQGLNIIERQLKLWPESLSWPSFPSIFPDDSITLNTEKVSCLTSKAYIFEAFQASILYSIMRTLCDSATLVPMIDEQTVRISQTPTQMYNGAAGMTGSWRRACVGSFRYFSLT